MQSKYQRFAAICIFFFFHYLIISLFLIPSLARFCSNLFFFSIFLLRNGGDGNFPPIQSIDVFTSSVPFVIFSLSSSSNEESQISLSNIGSLLFRDGKVWLVKSQEAPLLVEDQRTLSSLSANEPQLNKFHMRYKGYTNIAVQSFVLALHDRENARNIFIFYSRYRSIWDEVRQKLEAPNFIFDVHLFEKTFV